MEESDRKERLRKIFLGCFGLVIFIVIGITIAIDYKNTIGEVLNNVAYVYGYFYTPPFDGEMILDPSTDFPGQTYSLESPVRILRDDSGTFHVYAKSKRDAFFSQGYISGIERLLNIEKLRRMAYGTLAELKSTALLVDRMSRSLGFYRLALDDYEKMDEIDKKNLESYTSGINFYLDRVFDKYKPLEFRMLSKPEPFTVIDSLAMIRVMAWSFSRGWLSKIMKVGIRQWMGEDFEKSLDFVRLKKEMDNLMDEIPNEVKLDGSNSIVVSGKLSKSGHALLESDPHLAVQTPSLWIPVHLIIEEGDIDAYGIQISGCPGLAIGFNKNISYAVTLSYGDGSEIFLEKISKDGKKALFKDKYEDMEIITERYKVKGQEEEFVEDIRITRNGPLLTDILNFQDEKKYDFSMKLVPLLKLDKPTHLKFVTDTFALKNWDEFKDVCEKAKIVHINLMYADHDDNIGVCVAGNFPVRSEEYIEKHSGGICNGWEDICDWDGFYDHQPTMLNPEEGYIVSANHDYFKEKAPYYLGIVRSDWRAKRIISLIEERLEKNKKISTTFLEKVSTDPGIEGEALDFITFFTKLYEEYYSKKHPTMNYRTNTDVIYQIAKRITRFDGQFTPDSSTASLFVVFLNELMHILLERRGGPLSPEKEGSSLKRDRIILKGFHEKFLPATAFIGSQRAILKVLWKKELNEGNSLAELAEHVVEQSIIRTVKKLDKILNIDPQLSKDPREWFQRISYSEIHKISFEHVVGEYIPDFKKEVNAWGSFNTPNMGGYYNSVDNFNVMFYPTYRLIVDMHNQKNAKTMLFPGTSNYLNTGWMFNGVEPYLKNRLRKVVYSEKSVQKNKVTELRIFPGKIKSEENVDL